MNSIAIVVAACFLGVCAAQTCDSTRQDMLSEHPTDCTKYLQCDNGYLKPRECNSGTVFNPVLGACDFKFNVPSCRNQLMCDPNPCSAGQYCVEDSNADFGYICKLVTNLNACASNPCPSSHRCYNTVAVPEGYQCLLPSQQQRP